MKNNQKIKNIVILGGGTSGWMSASAFAKSLGADNYNITLIESDEIGTVGVGEATIPNMRTFIDFLGIEESEFMAKTNASFKLGIEFINWSKIGESYIHPFGKYGVDLDGIGFHHFWLRNLKLGGSSDFGRFNLETLAAREGRFSILPPSDVIDIPNINYAYHFDASLFAKYLRKYSEDLGVKRVEGLVQEVKQDPLTGFITELVLKNGTIIKGDLFIDCSGFRGILIEQTLKTGYEDWSAWLPCNRALAVPTEKVPNEVTPYTKAIAQEAGWQWRIPLQHRTGNGYVFCNEYISEDEAQSNLLKRLDTKPIKDPKLIKFVTGHRKKMWNKNVVAIGLASGFLEPLESTSIYLVQTAITKLLAIFPKDEIRGFVVNDYNKDLLNDYINVKDFLIAHYKVTARDDTPFWNYVRNMPIPESLQNRLDYYKGEANALVKTNELFKDASWFAVLFGQGLMPNDYHAIADNINEDDLKFKLAKLRTGINERLKGLPKHQDYLDFYCKSDMAL